MTETEVLRTLLDEEPDAPLPVLLDRFVDAVRDEPHAQERIAELVDESRAAWQWLLAGRRDGHILQIAGGLNASALALARAWKHVTVLEPTDTARRLQIRRAEDAGLDNLAVTVGRCEDRLPFDDGSFDAVCWSAAPGRPVPCAPDAEGAELTALVREAARVLKPGGELFLGLPNRWRRSLLKDGPRILRFRLRSVLGTLRAAGLTVHATHAHENFDPEQRFFVDLADRRAVSTFKARNQGLLHRLPAWLYRRTPPHYAVVAGDGPSRPSWLAEALAAVREHLGLTGDDWRQSPPAVNRKGKLMATLSRNGRAAWLVKIPLNPECLAGVENAHRLLGSLADGLDRDDPLAPLLPGGLTRLEHDGVPLFVESICEGRPWASRRSSRPRLLDTDLPDILARLMAVDATDLAPPADLEGKIAHLGDILDGRAPDLLPTLHAVGDRLSAAAEGRPLRLRKGDMTLSNVFLEGKHVSGLIDWDEAEASHLPLAAYADLVFSWLWQREGMRRTDSLGILADGDLDRMPRTLAVPETIERLGADADDLAVAALASWVDHAHHELKHPVFRYRPDRVRGLLVGPCRSLAESWGS